MGFDGVGLGWDRWGKQIAVRNSDVDAVECLLQHGEYLIFFAKHDTPMVLHNMVSALYNPINNAVEWPSARRWVRRCLPLTAPRYERSSIGTTRPGARRGAEMSAHRSR